MRGVWVEAAARTRLLLRVAQPGLQNGLVQRHQAAQLLATGALAADHLQPRPPGHAEQLRNVAYHFAELDGPCRIGQAAAGVTVAARLQRRGAAAASEAAGLAQGGLAGRLRHGARTARMGRRGREAARPHWLPAAWLAAGQIGAGGNAPLPLAWHVVYWSLLICSTTVCPGTTTTCGEGAAALSAMAGADVRTSSASSSCSCRLLPSCDLQDMRFL